MTPFYWQGTTNFGDYLNSWLWPELLDGYLDGSDEVRLVGVGSLLKSSLNIVPGKKAIFGTGGGYGSFPHQDDYKDWRFYFVRGPLTAKQFELDDKQGLIDGAWLAGLTKKYQRSFEKKGISLVPHWTTADFGNWQKICERAEINYISPLGDLHKTLNAIANSELVIAESLHGAIMADLFRTPWIPVSISPKFLPFKWADWFLSIGVDPSIKKLPLSDYFEYLYCGQEKARIQYSLDEVIMDCSVDKETAKLDLPDPNFFYRKKLQLKGMARNARRNLISASASVRDSFLFDGWNCEHQEKVVKLLREVASLRPNLSSDAVHAQKLEQLEMQLQGLKKDYDSGLLH